MNKVDRELEILKDANKRLSSIMKSIIIQSDDFEINPFVGICMDVKTKEIIKVNRAFRNYLGYTNDEVEGKKYDEFISLKWRTKTAEAHEKFIKLENITNGFFFNKYIAKDGTEKPLYWKHSNADQTNIDGFFKAYATISINVY